MENISVKLMIDNAQFVAQTAKSSQAIQRFGTNVKKSSIFMQTFVDFFSSQALLGGLSKLGSGLVSLAKSSIATAASYQRQKQAFGILLQDIDKGADLFEELKTFAAKTPLQLDDITEGTKKLLAFGVANDEVVETMRRLGDLSLGQADKLNSLTNAYGKLKAKGRATLEELNLFTENGVPLMSALAESMGVATEEVFALVSAGKVGFSDVNNAIQTLTDTGGRFAGMMESASQTLSGKWSTAKDVWTQTGGVLADRVTPELESILDITTQWGNEILKSEKYLQLISGELEPVASDHEFIIEKLQDISTETRQWADMGYTLASGGAMYVQSLSDAEKKLKEMNKLLATQTRAQRDASSYGSDDIRAQVEGWINNAAGISKAFAKSNLGGLVDARTKIKTRIDEINSSIATLRSSGQVKIKIEGRGIVSVNTLIREGKSVLQEYQKELEETQSKINDLLSPSSSSAKIPTPGFDSKNIDLTNPISPSMALSDSDKQAILQSIQSIKDSFNDMHKDRMTLLDEQAQKFIDNGVNEIEVQKWVTKETMALQAQKAASYIQLGQQIVGHMKGAWSEISTFLDLQDQEEINRYTSELERLQANKDAKIAGYQEEGLSKREAEEKYLEEELALKEKKEQKENEMKKRQFEANKVAKAADAIINTALGITGAWAQVAMLTPFGSAALSAVIGGIGATQLGFILAQQYPGLATGGIVPPQGEQGGLYRLGDKNKAEAVVPLDRMNQYAPGLTGNKTVINNYTFSISGFIGDENEIVQQIEQMQNRTRRIGMIE